jgi:hypothetical protein
MINSVMSAEVSKDLDINELTGACSIDMILYDMI